MEMFYPGNTIPEDTSPWLARALRANPHDPVISLVDLAWLMAQRCTVDSNRDRHDFELAGVSRPALVAKLDAQRLTH